MGNYVLLDAPSDLGLRPPAEGAVPGVRNAAAIGPYPRALASRIASIRSSGGFPVVLGGDCSISLDAMPAIMTGRGAGGLADIDRLRPYVSDGAVDSPAPDDRQAELVADTLERTFR